MHFNSLNRKLHKWGALIVALPLLVIILSGILLQFKKQADWIQPPGQEGTGTVPALSFDAILEAARSVPESEITTWDDVDRLDVRPGKGVIKVRAKNSYEIQIDAATGKILWQQNRLSDVIENIHDGSFFHDSVKIWIFFPAALILLGLLATGLMIFFQPYFNHRNRKGIK